MHPDLKYAGLLNPLDTPHHMRMDEPAKYAPLDFFRFLFVQWTVEYIKAIWHKLMKVSRGCGAQAANKRRQRIIRERRP